MFLDIVLNSSEIPLEMIHNTVKVISTTAVKFGKSFLDMQIALSTNWLDTIYGEERITQEVIVYDIRPAHPQYSLDKHREESDTILSPLIA